MRSTTTYERGQVVVVNVPFPNQTGSKRRPALIVSTSAFHRTLPDLVICPVSSRPRYYRRPGPGDCRIAGWKHVGLRHPSVVRISNIVAVEKNLIGRPLGRLRKAEWEQVAARLRLAFGL